MPQMFSKPSPKFHYEIADSLMNRSVKQLNIIAPRGHAKSSVVGGIYPIFHLMYDESPKVIILVSRTQGHAVELLRTIKDVFDYSDHFRSVFGYWGMHSASEWSKSQIKLKDGSVIICKGTGQQIRGIKVGTQRPTCIIVDDPEDENNTKTAESMEQNLRWLLQSAIPSLDPIRGRIAIIGTPQHQRCMVETLKEMDGWKNMYFAPNIEKNISLWEELHPVKRLIEKRNELQSINRISVFYREYLCQIVGDEDQLFREEYLQFYKGKVVQEGGYSYLNITELEGKSTDELRPVNLFMGVDPASSTKRTADYSTIVTIAIDKDMNRFVLPYYRKHASPMKLADSIIEYFRIYNPTKTRIETVGYQEMLRDYLKRKCEEDRLFISGLEIKENPRTSKSSRLETLEPYFAQKKFYIQKNMQELKDELLLYPRGKHDDLLDGLFYANKNIYSPHHDVKDKNKKKKTGNNKITTGDWLLS